MKILWINAIDPHSEVETRYPNLGIGYLQASLRKALGDDFCTFRTCHTGIEDVLDDFQPDLVGITAVSHNFDMARRYASIARSRNIAVMIGGVHITFLPETLSEDMDVGCIGEGEDTIVELVRIFAEHNAFPRERLKQVRGIVYHGDNGAILQSAPRPLIDDLNRISMPDRSQQKTASHTYMFTSRGCPFKCSFCASSRFWPNVRFFSAERVVNEIEILVNEHGATFVSFFDDLFIANKQRLFRIVELLGERKLIGKVKFSCSVRANTVTDDIVIALKKMGVVSVGMGLESGNERILQKLKGQSATLAHNKRAVEVLNRHHIWPNASFVIGSPDETEAEILDTLHFIKTSRLGLFDVYVLTPFPGTPIWDLAQARGLVSSNMDWSRINVNFEKHPEDAIIVSEVLSKAEIITLYRKFRRYRLFHNFKNVWTHPMLRDLPRYAFKVFLERLSCLRANR